MILLLLIFLQTLILSQHSSAASVSLDRVYSKVESSTGEHCAGWTIELWRTGATFVGQIEHHRGLCGDPPMSILNDVRYDPKDGSFSFTAKISDGTDGRGAYSCDRLTFEGRIDDTKLVGVMKWHGSGAAESSETLNLGRAKADPYGTRQYDSVSEWLKSREKVLKFRGPRC